MLSSLNCLVFLLLQSEMLRDFVRNLFDGKPISVGPPQKPEDSDLQSALEDIQAFEKDWQLELPGEPPAFSPDAALWSVCSLYVASSYLVHRDAEVQLHEDLLGTPPPDRAQIESHYSVDLTMRFLPDLLRLARTAAPEDPLVKTHARLGSHLATFLGRSQRPGRCRCHPFANFGNAHASLS